MIRQPKIEIGDKVRHIIKASKFRKERAPEYSQIKVVKSIEREGKYVFYVLEGDNPRGFLRSDLILEEESKPKPAPKPKAAPVRRKRLRGKQPAP